MCPPLSKIQEELATITVLTPVLYSYTAECLVIGCDVSYADFHSIRPLECPGMVCKICRDMYVL